MTDTINADDFTPPLSGEQVEQVQAIINEALRRQEGGAEALQTRVVELEQENAALRAGKSAVPAERKVSEYKNGEDVEVIKDGEWRRGRINGVEKRLGIVYVDTDRGPVTIASARSIRPTSG